MIVNAAQALRAGFGWLLVEAQPSSSARGPASGPWSHEAKGSGPRILSGWETRHPAAHAKLGEHPERGPPVHQVLPMDHDVLRARHHAGGAAFNLVGDALRDLLDPRLGGE